MILDQEGWPNVARNATCRADINASESNSKENMNTLLMLGKVSGDDADPKTTRNEVRQSTDAADNMTNGGNLREYVAAESSTVLTDASKHSVVMGLLKNCLKRKLSATDYSSDECDEQQMSHKQQRLSNANTNVEHGEQAINMHKGYDRTSESNAIDLCDVTAENGAMTTEDGQRVLLTDCVTMEDGNIHIIEENVRQLWNRTCIRLNKGKQYEEQTIMESLEFFKHMCQYPNVEMQKSTRKFWLHHLTSEMMSLSTRFPEQFMKYNILPVGIMLLHVLLKGHYASWNPISDNFLGLSSLEVWAILLRRCSSSLSIFEITEVYCGKILMKMFTVANLNQNSNAMAHIIQKWTHLLPKHYMTALINDTILPCLITSMATWSFPTSISKIITVIKPWQCILGEKMRYLQMCISQTVFKSLDQSKWKASDPRVRLLIKGLMPMIDAKRFERFLSKCLLPRISSEMKAAGEKCLIMNNNDRKQWDELMLWSTVIDVQHISLAMTASFFPAFLYNTKQFIRTKPEKYSVMSWYSNWTNAIPNILKDIICIHNYLNEINSVVKLYEKQDIVVEAHSALNIDIHLEPLDLTWTRCNLVDTATAFIKEEPEVMMNTPLTNRKKYKNVLVSHMDYSEIKDMDNYTLNGTHLNPPVEKMHEKPVTEVITNELDDTVIPICSRTTNDDECDEPVKMPINRRQLTPSYSDVNHSTIALNGNDKRVMRPKCSTATSCGDGDINKSMLETNLSHQTNNHVRDCPDHIDPEAPTVKHNPNSHSVTSAFHQLHVLPDSLLKPTRQLVTYKQRLANKAKELDILFTPVLKKFEGGNQVYTFGNKRVYIQDGFVCVQSVHGTWERTRVADMKHII